MSYQCENSHKTYPDDTEHFKDHKYMGFESPFLVLNMIGKCCLPTPIHILRPLFSSPFSMQSLFLLDKIPANLITLSGWLRRRQQVEDESYTIHSC